MNDKPEERDEQRNEGLSTAALAGVREEKAVTNVPVEGASTAGEEQMASLFNPDEASNLRRRWDEIQVGFVDEPRRCVEAADNLVASTMKRMAEMFAEERSKLESQWDKGDNVSTEDLRVALRRYRSFFNRLLSM